MKKKNMNERRCMLAAVIATTMMLSIGCSGNKESLFRVEKTQEAMGTFVTVVACHEDRSLAGEAVQAAHDEVNRVSGVMNRYDENSEVSRLNRSGTEQVSISGEMVDILSRSLEYNIMTGGVFDITVGPLVREWRRAKKEGRIPDPGAIEVAREKVGSEKVDINEDNKTLQFRTSGMEIDLGGIAKGYAADRAAEVMKDMGIKNGLVNAGGDIYAFGTREDGMPWTIGIQEPSLSNELTVKLKISDVAVATSGDYRQYISSGGKTYSHIYDPRTGENSDCVSATVVASEAITADALATAVCVLGPVDGIELADKHKGMFEAMVIDREGNVSRSSGFDGYIEK